VSRLETPCAARRFGQDQMHCAVCRLLWDVGEETMCSRGVREPVAERPLRVEAPPRFISALAPDFIS
jgi:hypothetical protein